jgi:hypothetical protein
MRTVDRMPRSGVVLVAALVLATLGIACLDLAWREGIACDAAGRCPGDLTCCGGACRKQCASADDAGGGAQDAEIVVCPPVVGGCFACMPGCACSCAGATAMCCLKIGVATCGGCP